MSNGNKIDNIYYYVQAEIIKWSNRNQTSCETKRAERDTKAIKHFWFTFFNFKLDVEQFKVAMKDLI